jgi:hypothetical protein
MSIAVRQITTPVGGNAVATSITSNAPASPFAIGSIIEVSIACEPSGVITSVVDSASQVYTLIGSVNDATDSSFIAKYALNNNLSNTAFTVEAFWNGSGAGGRNIQVIEIIGAQNKVADASNFPGRFQGTNATNGLSIALTTSSAPVLVSGFLCAVSGSGLLAAGTGFTGQGSFASGAGFGGAGTLFVTGRFTGINPPCLWTDTTHGGTTFYLGCAVAWDEAPTGTPLPYAPYTPMQIFVNDNVIQLPRRNR